mmetsp:Transcript_23736/g.48709  ORF Transcript_23736/g.48709 Transcript_23736/m.48709 type:complete len:120 (+) Transcript_23736:275-634(+)
MVRLSVASIVLAALGSARCCAAFAFQLPAPANRQHGGRVSATSESKSTRKWTSTSTSTRRLFAADTDTDGDIDAGSDSNSNSNPKQEQDDSEPTISIHRTLHSASQRIGSPRHRIYHRR